MSRVLVAGIGNELRGDDAAGLLAVRALRELGASGVDVEEHAGDVARLAESISRHEEVVLIDAVSVMAAPGTVLRLSPDDPVARGSTSSHGLGLREAISLARLLGASPGVSVLGIVGADFSLGAAPSPAVAAAARRVAADIRETYACA